MYVPQWLFPAARRLYRRIAPQRKRPGRSLAGDREVEFSFIAANLPPGPGKALDFGSGPAVLSLEAAERGYEVTALDMISYEEEIFWRHPAVKFVIGDVLSINLPLSSFDVVMNCSAVEHVGLAGQYAVEEERSCGDLEAMQAMRQILKPDGLMLLTVPCGRDSVFRPFFRVYGEQRLPCLLKGFRVEKQEFWVKDDADRWVLRGPDEALAYTASADPLQPFYNSYALGCFVLRRSAGDEREKRSGSDPR